MTSNLEKLYKDLRFNEKKEFIRIDKKESYNIPLRYKNAILEMKPEAIFCIKEEPIILFFNLENYSNPEQYINKIHKQCWNFDKAPIIVISTYSDIVFYNAFDLDTKTNKLNVLVKSEKEFQNFAYENLYTGAIFKKYNIFNNRTRLYSLLFEHIKNYRSKLISEGLTPSIANSLLARMIFLKYIQDREIIIDDSNHDIINNSLSSKKKLYRLFEYLKEKFSGDLFDIYDDEETLVKEENIKTLQYFATSTDISGQISLFPFDFSIIPIELVSSIYENFLNLKQKENKSFYTPTFLVDYIINNTVNRFLKDKNNSNCRVLDPACGSGIFLIETLRKIIEKEENISRNRISPKRLIELVEDNIFGIDKDEDAINIAIFSLYITLLDYQEPKSILKFKFPHLKNKNFFIKDFFDISAEFNNLFKEKVPHFILSNPPYGNIKKGNHLKWCKNNKVPNNNNQIAQSFLARIRDFSSKETTISMVVTSKILYNINAKKFREYFLSNFKIEQVFELSAVRKQVFNNVVPPICILIYNCNFEISKNNGFLHYAIKPNFLFKNFNVLLLEKNDIKVVSQNLLYKYDWLWKTILFGNILDFYFIKRLKENYKPICSIEEIYCGQGVIQYTGKYDSSHLIDYPFLNTQNKELRHFYIEKNNSLFNKKKIHRVRNNELFKAPACLVKRGLDTDLACVSAFSNRNLVFTNSVYAIKSKKNNKKLLKDITGFLNSDLAKYLILLLATSAGVEREEIREKEFMSFPFFNRNDVSSLVDALQENYNEHTYKKLNNLIYENYNLNEAEKDLIDYALRVSIPVWKYGDQIFNTKEPDALKEVKDEELKYYCDIFIQSFSKNYRNFNVDIYKFKYCTLVNFKARDNHKPKYRINIKNIDDIKFKEIIKSLTTYSISDITNEIYIKKDIKGFNKNSFFVLKTNEYKNWHRVIARLDVNEFSNAIWNSEFK